MREPVDPHKFLVACDAIFARPDDYSKDEIAAMLREAARIIGWLMLANDLEREADDELRATPTEGSA